MLQLLSYNISQQKTFGLLLVPRTKSIDNHWTLEWHMMKREQELRNQFNLIVLIGFIGKPYSFPTRYFPIFQNNKHMNVVQRWIIV